MDLGLDVVSGFLRDVVENCVLLGYYEDCSDNFFPMFRDNLSFPSSGFEPLRMGPISFPETSRRNYNYSLRNNSEESCYGYSFCVFYWFDSARGWAVHRFAASCSVENRQVYRRRGVKLTTLLSLVSSLRMRGAVSQLYHMFSWRAQRQPIISSTWTTERNTPQST